MLSKHEIIEEIRAFAASKEFKNQFEIWSVKTSKELFMGYWKIVSAFIAVISFLLVLVIGYVNHTIDKLQITTSALALSVARLETTVNLMYEEKYNVNKVKYDFKKRNPDGSGS
jgi:hypothetical protein